MNYPPSARWIWAAAALLWLATSSHAQTNSLQTTPNLLLTFAGRVEVAKEGTSAWLAGKTNQVLKVGDRVRTGGKSRATIRFSNLSLLRLDQFTTYEIQPPTEPGKNPVLDLKAGASYFFNRDKPLDTQFRTPSASGAIRGTEFNLAVNNDGKTTLTLIDGKVDLSNEAGALTLNSGEQATAEKGKAPQKTAVIDAVNVIQWTLYYPAILDLNDLELSSEVRQKIADSLEAYQAGDLPQAMAKYPEDRTPASNPERVYHAALLLAVGQVAAAEESLNKISGDSGSNTLADALREMIAAVKLQKYPHAGPRSLATELLAGSYAAQAERNLTVALTLAKAAAAKDPNFAFALERIAELEFSFGHTSAALKTLNKSLKLAPRSAQALALKGFLRAAQNKMSSARKSFDKAIAIDGSLGNAWLGRGLVRIKKGDIAEGRKDLQTAAALEPNRAILRSYAGKAFSQGRILSLNPKEPFSPTWNTQIADKELKLAKKLDPNDPTAWLYSALLNEQRNRINEAIADLEHSQDLNNNRAVYRSQMLLDQDRAVRSANLAAMYRDAGLTDVSVREATKSLASDYANFSAHLFLAESYDALRDPKKRNLRYETPWLNELLLANLLAPVGAGALSQNISQQEYSRLFETDRLGVSSRTEYLSTGDWIEDFSQFGTLGTFGYALDAYYRSEHGFRPNNDVTDESFAGRFKQQLTAQDTLFLQISRNETRAGDVNQYFYQTNAIKDLRTRETQEPDLLAGLHHEWNAQSHTLFMFRRLDDDFALSASDQQAVYLLRQGTNHTTIQATPIAVGLNLHSEMTAYSTELQQILETPHHTFIVGGRYQFGDNDTTDTVQSLNNQFRGSQTKNDSASTDFWRGSIYAYDQIKPIDSLRLTAGVSYDRLHFPQNIDLPPIQTTERDRERISPKVGLDWTPFTNTRFRAAYTRSLSGLFNDANTRIEPSEVAGFNQAFRSLIPESVAGNIPGSAFETWHVGVDQNFPTRTYAAIEGEFLNSRGDRFEGVYTNIFFVPALADAPSSTRKTFRFYEKSLAVNVNQLIDNEWSLGARYRLSSATLNSAYADATIIPSQHNVSTLHQLSLYANYNLPCGFFSQLQGVWSSQSNRGFAIDEPGDDFWHVNFFAGYRFPNRHAEIRLGVLNIGDRDYHLEPLTLYQELPHRRTFAASVKFTF